MTSMLMQLGYPEILLSIFSFIFFYYYYKYKKNSRLLTNWPIFGMLPIIIQRQKFYHIATEVLTESGCTFLFKGPWFCGMNILFTCDPADIQHIFNVNFSNYPKGEEFAQIFDILGNGIFNADEDSWKKQRMKAHRLINDRNFRSFVARSIRKKVETGLVPFLSQIAQQELVVDLQDVFLRLTFDTTSFLVFGADPCSLSVEFQRIPFASAMDDAMNALFLRHTIPPAIWKLFKWLNIGAEKKLAKARKVIDNLISEKIAEKKNSAKDHSNITNDSEELRTNLLSSYIDDDDNDDEHSSPENHDKFLRDTAISFMLAGRDTTGVALTWFFWILTKNPMVEAKILAELRTISVSNSSSGTDNNNPILFDNDDLGKLLYLHAALCESLRLFPSVPLEHKGVLRPDVLPSGNKVGPSLQILVPIYCMARMEGIWGEDCMEFKPERWITDHGKLRHEPSYKFLSFNSGPRTCLGKEVAFTQMKAVVATMLYNFHVEVIEGQIIEPKLSIILYMRDGLMVKIRKRIN